MSVHSQPSIGPSISDHDDRPSVNRSMLPLPPHARLATARRVAWLVPLVLLPLAGAWGLHSLNAYVAQRTMATLQLQKLQGDLNGTAAEMALAVVLQQPGAASDTADLRADAASAASDIADLRAGGVDDPGVVSAERASAAFLATLQGVLAMLNNPAFDLARPAAASAIGTAEAQYDGAATSIAAASTTLQRQSETAGVYAEIGIWTIVVVGSAALIGVMWRAEVRQRRGAVEDLARRLLATSERTYRLLFDRNPTPMWTFDTGTLRFLTVNRAAMVKYGYSREEFLGMTILDIRPEPDRATFKVSSRLGSQHPTKIVAKHLLRDGRVIDVEVAVDDLDIDGRLTTLVLARDVTDERRLEAELQQRAFHDSLTGLPNRALLSDRFEHAQAVRARETRGLALMVIDLDGFKATNDAFGHGVGDEVLRVVAARLLAAVRPQDTVARLGGDEFAVLIEGPELGGAIELGARVIEALSLPCDANGRSIEVRPSTGLTAVEAHGITLDEALQHADVAMYEAKSAGSGELRVFKTGMRSGVLERLEMTSDLKRAIARNELVLHYQPIVATERPSAPVDHVEALVRWLHPTRGLVPPNDFIPIAEQTGAIVPLGAWVLRGACEQVRAWEELDRRVSVSVNVSSRELREPDFVASVVETLAKTGVAPGRLTMEVTETALLEDLQDATRVLNELRRMGVRVALDDFGAGYSSLSYLDRLPVDVVKIDRAFVAGLDNASTRATLLTIVHLLDTMNVLTVAEGVETAAQFAHLKSLGIHSCQGFLFSRPVPAAELLDAVRSHYRGDTDTPAAA
jgi:diguanylate cyclase (GGDEF)-like protein/PAS domain S-box-containing protein